MEGNLYAENVRYATPNVRYRAVDLSFHRLYNTIVLFDKKQYYCLINNKNIFCHQTLLL
jgi:hypothetical protein